MRHGNVAEQRTTIEERVLAVVGEGGNGVKQRHCGRFEARKRRLGVSFWECAVWFSRVLTERNSLEEKKERRGK